MVAIAPRDVPAAPAAGEGGGSSVPASLRAGQVLLLVEGPLWLGAAAWMLWRSVTGLSAVNSFFQCDPHCGGGGMAGLVLIPLGLANLFLWTMLMGGVSFAVVANVGVGCGIALTRRVRAARVIAIVIASLGVLVDVSLLRYVPPATNSSDWMAAVEAAWAPPRIPVVLLGAATLLANIALIYLLGFARGTVAAFHRPPPSSGAWPYPYPPPPARGAWACPYPPPPPAPPP